MDKIILIFFLFLFNFSPVALADNTVAKFKEQALNRKLAESSKWLALGHYRKPNFPWQAYTSSINDARFFLSPVGSENPEQELLATIEAAFTNQARQSEANNSTLCRYPARYRWLHEQLGLLNAVPEQPACSDYTDWRNMIQAHSLALVYASSHLNSPSSMYGHTLLRVDSPDFAENEAVLLSTAISFGANIPEGENGLLYAYKGIFGGYPGRFNVLPYMDKLKEYARLENRDLWEYHLNLTPDEVDNLVVHLWELKDINFKYFFFDENCSYQLLELLDIARPGQAVREGYPTVVIPVDTVRGVIATGFVEKTVYRPSAATRLRTKTRDLSNQEQQLTVELSNDINVLQSPSYQALPTDTRYQVTDAAYDFIRIQHSKSAASKEVKERSYSLLREINHLPKTAMHQVPKPEHPEQGHNSGSWSLTPGRQDSQNYLDFDFRMSFHDLEDNLGGYMPGSSINMGRFRLRQKEGESLQLQQFDIIDINSLSPRDQFFKPISWRTSVGYERYRMEDMDQELVQANGGGGVSYTLTENGLFYALATGRIEYNEGFVNDWQAALGFTTGVLYHFSDATLHLGFDGYKFANDYRRSETFIKYHYALAKDLGLQLRFSHHSHADIDFDDAAVELRYYY